MPLPYFARQTISVQDAGKRTVNGTEVNDWSNPTPWRNYRGWAAPATSEEYSINREATRTGYNVMLHPQWAGEYTEVIISEDSKVRLPDGNDYHVEGQPFPVTRADGTTDHWFFHAERWEG